VCCAYRSLAASPPVTVDREQAAVPTTEDPCPTRDESPPSEPERMRGVSLRAMLACGGIVSGWFAAAVAIPVAAIEGTFARDETFELIVSGDVRADSRRGSPDVPPPRA
jgi:hypothetical protein